MVELAATKQSSGAEEYVVFQLGAEYYAVTVDHVKDIRRMEPITDVPHAPSFVEGIINYRGSVMPVIDLRKRLDLPLTEATKHTRIMVVEVGRSVLGMIVDGVSEVIEIQSDTVEPPSPILLDIDSDFLRGIAKVKNAKTEVERLVVILDLDKILSAQSQEALEEFTGSVADA